MGFLQVYMPYYQDEVSRRRRRETIRFGRILRSHAGKMALGKLVIVILILSLFKYRKAASLYLHILWLNRLRPRFQATAYLNRTRYPRATDDTCQKRFHSVQNT